MEESDKLPLKRVELSLTKFNEVAIPHHLDLLRQHKVNIIKHERLGEYVRVRSEQANARRVAQQLRTLLGELEALRRRVRDADLPRFDALTQRARDDTLRSIVDYLEMPANAARMFEPSPSPSPRPVPDAAVVGSVTSTESVGLVTELEQQDTLQLHVNEHELALREREEVLRGYSSLQTEVRALHDAWQHVQAAALHHREHVAVTATTVDLAADNVHAARAHLSAAERLRAGAWVAGGAVCGVLAGGPVGFAVGLKAGAAAALAGSVLGALGVRALGRRVPLLPPAETNTETETKTEVKTDTRHDKKQD